MSDDDTRARMARLAKEREEAMGGSPSADTAAPQPSSEDVELQARMARLAEERAKEFGTEDTTPRENEARLEAGRVAAEKQTALEQQEKARRDAQLNTAINLGVAGVGASIGAGYRNKFSAPVDMGSNNMYTRWLERKYNLPAGSWEMYLKQRQLQASNDPAINATVEEFNRQAEAQNNAAVVPAEQTVQAANGAPIVEPVDPAKRAKAIFNYAVEHGLSTEQAARAIDNTSQKGGTHYILQNEVRPGALKAQELFPGGASPLPEAPNIYVPNAPSRPRQEGDVSYKRLQHFPANAKPSAALNNPELFQTGRSAPTAAGALPVSEQPAVAEAQAPLAQLSAEQLTPAAIAERKAGKNAGRALGFMGGAITAEQAYHMAMDYLKNKVTPDWTQLTSLAGGPLVTFGGRRLGPLGLAMQIPYAVKHREDIARGMTMGDIAPYGTLTEAEANQPVPIFHMDRQ